MKKSIGVVILVSLCIVSLGAVAPDRLQFKKAGFSIQALEDRSGSTGYQALIMSLPPSDGFAANVNVMIQPYSGTIDEYAALSKKQFVEANLSLIKETRLNQTSVVLEYSGELQKRRFHWYAKATSTGKSVYLATATATETQWDTVASKLKVCVDSLTAGK